MRIAEILSARQFVRFILETTKWIYMEFDIGGLHETLSVEFTYTSHCTNITAIYSGPHTENCSRKILYHTDNWHVT